MKKKNTCALDNYIYKLQKKRIKSYDEIPEELRNETEIIQIARRQGLRKITKCGFDVISGLFFVEETIMKIDDMLETYFDELVTTFSDFQTYFEFLQGNIYENACYYQFNFTPETINQFHIDLSKIKMRADLNCTVDDILPEASTDEKEYFDAIESQMLLRKKWIKKYNACSTYEEFVAVNKKHYKTNDRTDEAFYIWNFINYHGEKVFDIIMKFVSAGKQSAPRFKNATCFLFDAQRALENFKYTGGVSSTNKKHNTQFKQLVNEIATSKITTKTKKFFDKHTHYFCVKKSIYLDATKRFPSAELYRYFETFDEFSAFLGNDLSDCDLSKALKLNIDFSLFKTNPETKLPINAFSDLKKVVQKRYNYVQSHFEVIIKWFNSIDIEVFERKHTFKYFFDFVAFLNNDLSEADLLLCDDLKNITDFSDLNLKNARISSQLKKRLGLPYEKFDLLNNELANYAIVNSNESKTSVILKEERHELATFEASKNEHKVYYITDLHLLHRLHNAHCVTFDDCICVIQHIIFDLLESLPYRSLLLIGGDVSSEYWAFELFVELLRRAIDERYLHIKVVFLLGNHELWNFEGLPLDSIIEKYRSLLANNNMQLLQNEILYINEDDNTIRISNNELYNLTDKEIREKLRAARTIIFGGIGFSGYNNDFNANNGIYRSTLTRDIEISESQVFEVLYDRVCACLSDKNVIILTHMPFADWHKEGNHQKNFVYVSGHNHKNDFYDDGVVRIYADNQVGYLTEHPKLKYFRLDSTYDWFSEYMDGIHNITRDDYINFYRGKNLPLTFNRDINKLYMLKKNDYYCFIHENLSGSLTILNGGTWKALKQKDIQWYYENMDAEIEHIKVPLNKFQSFLQQISNAIIEIGGSGDIHGAIVDIDFYNHIYVNPFDLTITPYFAWDIIEKTIYPDIPSLLKSNCPSLYANYKNFLADGHTKSLITKVKDNGLIAKPELYLSTDIYAASREIKKMQKLNLNILSSWFDNIPGIKALPSHEAIRSPIGETQMMKCGMAATIIEYTNYNDISVKFEDGTIVKHITKSSFKNRTVKNPNLTTKKSVLTSNAIHKKKKSYCGKTNVMKCGLKATVIEDFGYKDITIQFEDGLIRKHRRRDHFDLGKIAHITDESE